MITRRDLILHVIIGFFAVLTLVPFLFTLNNAWRTNAEMFRSFFGLPESLTQMVEAKRAQWAGVDAQFEVETDEGEVITVGAAEACGYLWRTATRGFRRSWVELRRYMINTFVTCGITACGVVFIGSMTAYILSRYRFFGSKTLFYYIIAVMMFPGVLTLVPSFLLVKNLGLLNTYLAMILPYIAGGQVFAIFVFKGFFDGLPEDLFESARIDGAGHIQLYLNIILPLSKPILSVVTIMNVLSTWNNFLWPFIVNTDRKYDVVASGLYVLATSAFANSYSTLFSAYMLSAIPLLVLFTYATRPFIQGVTSGAFKA